MKKAKRYSLDEIKVRSFVTQSKGDKIKGGSSTGIGLCAEDTNDC